MSSFVSDDPAGSGVEYRFKARPTTTADGDLAVSATYPTRMMVDVVAPVFATGGGNVDRLRFDPKAQMVRGWVFSSADEAGRAGESSFSVTVTRPAGSSTTATTLKCESGAAVIDGAPAPSASCPAAGASADEAGVFALPVPRGVLLQGDASATVSDVANVSAPSRFDMTMPTVSALPKTGGQAPIEWLRRALLAVVAVVFALSAALARRQFAAAAV
ncbi:hypothetical protein [Bifidobacterium bohemicum]|nr:hypothetical protein [Bifidobacterium bohemicum]